MGVMHPVFLVLIVNIKHHVVTREEQGPAYQEDPEPASPHYTY